MQLKQTENNLCWHAPPRRTCKPRKLFIYSHHCCV